jgi:flagellar biosynthesis protein FlhF
MRIKSYFAGSVQEAIESARAELGSEAMLLHSKKTEWELRSLGAYEVVFGVSAGMGPAQPAETAGTAGLVEQPDELVRSSEVVKELADLRKQIETVRRSVVRHSVVRNGSALPAGGNVEAEEICASLAAADFSEELAGEIAEAVAARVGAPSQAGRMALAERYDAALAAELERRLRVEPQLGRGAAEAGEARGVLFAGPAGSGKTSSLIKLAIRYSLDARLAVQILSLDTLRVGGWEQLAAYARIAGLPFDIVHNPNLLGEALAEYSGKKLILVDSPGFSPAELEDMPELPSELDVHLVLPATLTARVAARTLERFAPLRPAKLLFTHLDEMETPGVPLEMAMRSGLAISFLAGGRQIPEDIREASKAELLAPLLGRQRRQTIAATQQIAASAA